MEDEALNEKKNQVFNDPKSRKQKMLANVKEYNIPKKAMAMDEDIIINNDINNDNNESDNEITENMTNKNKKDIPSSISLPTKSKEIYQPKQGIDVTEDPTHFQTMDKAYGIDPKSRYHWKNKLSQKNTLRNIFIFPLVVCGFYVGMECLCFGEMVGFLWNG